MIKTVLATLGVVIAIILLGWFLEANDLAFYKFWAPKRAAAERQVYQETPSYINGNRQALLNQVATIRQTKDPEARATARAALRLQVNGLPADFPVPAEVRDELSQPDSN